jgi:hypothetical protein
VAALDADDYRQLSRNALERAHAMVWDKPVDGVYGRREAPRGQAPAAPLRLEASGDIGSGNAFGNGSQHRVAYDIEKNGNHDRLRQLEIILDETAQKEKPNKEIAVAVVDTSTYYERFMKLPVFMFRQYGEASTMAMPYFSVLSVIIEFGLVIAAMFLFKIIQTVIENIRLGAANQVPSTVVQVAVRSVPQRRSGAGGMTAPSRGDGRAAYRCARALGTHGHVSAAAPAHGSYARCAGAAWPTICDNPHRKTARRPESPDVLNQQRVDVSSAQLFVQSTRLSGRHDRARRLA